MSTTTMSAGSASTSSLGRSNLTQQFEANPGLVTPKSNRTRSISDAPPKPTLSPSPAIRESPQKPTTRDDFASTDDPITPRRPSFSMMKGLSLQVPLKQDGESSSTSRIPLSPKLEPSNPYGSPSSVLPRRSRGLDFARACTNLHHSTLAESSPDASPITGRGINIPQRRGITSNHGHMESPSQSQVWTAMTGEKTTLSSSVSSINMMDSETDSDDSSIDMAMDREADDPVLSTPAASRFNKLNSNSSPGMDWLTGNQPNSQVSLLNFQPHRMSFRRSRLRNNKSSHSSSSVSMRSSKPSPGPLSPPIRQSVESGGYFGTAKQARSRRESLSLGTDDLHLSDSEWDNSVSAHRDSHATNSSNDAQSERGVVKRAVTRRSNLLPKTKGFARIRAALMEESDPLHTEARREAEVIKQVQESDSVYNNDNVLGVSTTAEPLEESIELSSTDDQPNAELATEPFGTHAKRHSGGLGFWDNFEHTPPNSDRYRTPPPPSLMPQDSTASEGNTTSNNTTQDPSIHSTGSTLFRQLHQSRSRSRSTTPLASACGNVQLPSSADIVRKVNNKRRRDDDFDPASFKRRAVSPGMLSAQSSPVVPQSPTMTNDKSWGKPPPKTHADRSNSASSNTGTPNGSKRVGLQGMTEASDGFMSMSID